MELRKEWVAPNMHLFHHENSSKTNMKENGGLQMKTVLLSTLLMMSFSFASFAAGNNSCQTGTNKDQASNSSDKDVDNRENQDVRNGNTTQTND